MAVAEQSHLAAENFLQLGLDAETLEQSPVRFRVNLDEGLAAGENQRGEIRDLPGGFVVVHPAFGDVRGQVVADGPEGQILLI